MTTAANTPIERIVAALEQNDCRPRRNGNEWNARCPAHDDDKPSLSVGIGDDGRALLYCHAGCTPMQICESLGLALRNLMPPRGRGQPPKRNRRRQPAAGGRTSNTSPPSISSPRDGGNGPRRIEAEYEYFDADGELLFQVVRFEGKQFRQRRPDGNNGWSWNMAGVARVLYRLPDIVAAPAGATVFLVEGERDVERLYADGPVVATTTSSGAGKAHLTDLSPLYGRPIVILADNDDAGRKHAQQLATLLYGKAATVRVVELPDLPDKGDVSDWLEAGNDVEALVALAKAAPEWKPIVDADNSGAVLVRLADVEPTRVRWLWPDRIALGKVTLLAGDPGLGKSFLTIDIAARTSAGLGWPDRPLASIEHGGVVLLSAEDDLADTIRPRLDAAGADVSRIVSLEAVRDEDGQEHVFSLADSMPALETAIAETPDCKLVIVDPISAFTGHVDSHKNAEVRGLLAPLAKLAADRGVAVLAVTHLRKSEGPAVYRPMGSLAFAAAARAVFAVARDPKDEMRKRRLMLPVKSNIAADQVGLAFSLVRGNGAMRIAWSDDAVTMTADEALAPLRRKPGPDSGERAEAAEWLRAELADGPRPAKELIEEACEGAGFSAATVKRARKELQAVSYRPENPGPWWWKLTDEAEDQAEDQAATQGDLSFCPDGAENVDCGGDTGAGAQVSSEARTDDGETSDAENRDRFWPGDDDSSPLAAFKR